MTVTALYTNFGGMLLHEDRAGVERAYLPDTLGSLIAEIDETGALTYEASYWPYGEIQSESGSKDSPWGFVGLLGYLKDLVNLLYVRARHYLPHQARWLTVDPFWPDEPTFSYGEQSPTTNTDVTGLRSKPCSSAGQLSCRTYCKPYFWICTGVEVWVGGPRCRIKVIDKEICICNPFRKSPKIGHYPRPLPRVGGLLDCDTYCKGICGAAGFIPLPDWLQGVPDFVCESICVFGARRLGLCI